MKILHMKKILMGFVLVLICGMGYAHNPPTFSIDTKNFSLKINGKDVDKSNIDAILTAIDHGHRKVDKPNKTYYIYDELGFAIEKDAKGIVIKLFFAKGEKENDPSAIFSGKLEINSLNVTPIVPVNDIVAQLPKSEKTVVMKDILMYISPIFVLTGESNNGSIKELDFGFINK